MLQPDIVLRKEDTLFNELQVWEKWRDEPRYIGDEWFRQRVLDRLPQSTGVFPYDVRWIAPNGLGAIFEVPPGRRMITFTNANQWAAAQGLKKEHTIFVHVPRTIIGVIMDRNFAPVTIWCFIVDGSLTGWSNHLKMCPLPNVYTDGRICLPSSDRRFDQTSFTDGLYAAYEAVWDTRYNTDLVDALQLVRREKRPSVIWESINAEFQAAQKRREERANRLREAGVRRRFYYRRAKLPRVTPLQIFRHWARLTPEQVMEISDWPQCSEMPRLDSLKEAIENYTRVDQQPELFRNITESVGF